MCFPLLRSGHTLGIGCGLLAATVRATPTDPFLALRSATATSGAVVVVRVEGSSHASDHTQLPFPLQLLVRDLDSGVEYVRYAVANGGFSPSVRAARVASRGRLPGRTRPLPGGDQVDPATGLVYEFETADDVVGPEIKD